MIFKMSQVQNSMFINKLITVSSMDHDYEKLCQLHPPKMSDLK